MTKRCEDSSIGVFPSEMPAGLYLRRRILSLHFQSVFTTVVDFRPFPKAWNGSPILPMIDFLMNFLALHPRATRVAPFPPLHHNINSFILRPGNTCICTRFQSTARLPFLVSFTKREIGSCCPRRNDWVSRFELFQSPLRSARWNCIRTLDCSFYLSLRRISLRKDWIQ